MRHVSIGEKSLLTGDDVTELLVRYAALLAQQHTADTVDIAAFDTTGSATVVTLLLNEGMTLVAETVPSGMQEPDNRSVEAYLRTGIDTILRRENPPFDEIAGATFWNGAQPD